jgi:formate dehydrogenase major subunit/formate dehydrogenase-N alpha subunit
MLRDDGTTSSYCWIFAGSWTEAGNQMARRDNTDTGLGNTPAGPGPGRPTAALYNRASADPAGKPWDPSARSCIGTAGNGAAPTCPTIR